MPAHPNSRPKLSRDQLEARKILERIKPADQWLAERPRSLFQKALYAMIVLELGELANINLGDGVSYDDLKKSAMGALCAGAGVREVCK